MRPSTNAKPGPTIRIIGAACGLGFAPHAPSGGADASAGPAGLRAVGIEAAVQEAGLSTEAGPHIETGSAPRMEALGSFLRALADAVATSLTDGAKPVILGGDHAIAAGTWRGVSRALGTPPGLIWIDAHLDAHTPESTPSGNPHGMPLAALLGKGATEMVDIAGTALDPARIAVLGVRSYESAEASFLSDRGVQVFEMAEIHRRGLAAVFADALTIASPEGRPYGISLDLDAIDPETAPGVSTPVSNGIASGDLCQALAGRLRSPSLVALEIAEYNPGNDPTHTTARLAVALLAAACSGGTARCD